MHRIGVMPFRLNSKDEFELLFVTSQTRKRWILPKGNAKSGESPEDVCHREAFEEAGIKGVVLSNFPLTSVVGRLTEDGIERIPVTYYPMLVQEEADKWPEVNDRRRRWVSYSKLKKYVRDDDVRKIVRNFEELTPWIKEVVEGLSKKQLAKLKLVK